jgi:hypothetical protein
MATKVQTEQVYGGNQSAGVAVSLLPIFFLKYLLIVSPHFLPLGARRLRYALAGFRFGHVRCPRGMYHFTRQMKREFA